MVGPVGAAGAGTLVAVDGTGLDVGTVGSISPAPGDGTGLPSMLELQPDTGVAVTSTGESTRQPPTMPNRAFWDNRTRTPEYLKFQDSDYSVNDAGDCVDAPVDAGKSASRIISAAR